MKREKPTQDLLELWLEEGCSIHPDSANPARGLFHSWIDWLGRNHHLDAKAGSPRAFSNALTQLGFPWHRKQGCRTRVHVGLRARLPARLPGVSFEAEGSLISYYAERYW